MTAKTVGESPETILGFREETVRLAAIIPGSVGWTQLSPPKKHKVLNKSAK